MSALSRAAAAAVAATMLVPFIATISAGPAFAADVVTRSAGPDRIATAVAASQDHRATAMDALLATAANFPDALGGAALAARLNAPVLLSEHDHLPASVDAELRRLGVQTVWLLGGPGAIGAPVEQALAAQGYTVHRIAGAGRFDTAARVAELAGPSAAGEVVLALGEHPTADRAWPDAVAGGALAATPDPLPTLLTRGGSLPVETEAALKRMGTRTVLLIGGTGSVGTAVADRLVELGYSVRRIAGASRYETSALLAEEALARAGGGTVEVVFATGASFPDALSAAALAGTVEGPLVLVPPNDLAHAVDTFLRAHTDRWSRGVVVGGTAAADDFVIEQVDAAMRGAAPPTREVVTSTFAGHASWYGPGFDGRATASGEPFDRTALTAAHRSLPFGTRVRVTNPANGAVVTVRINDRGPYSGGRVIDLSQAGADALGYRADGTAYITAEVLG